MLTDFEVQATRGLLDEAANEGMFIDRSIMEHTIKMRTDDLTVWAGILRGAQLIREMRYHLEEKARGNSRSDRR